MTNIDTCFQCGKRTIVISVKEEYINKSLVVSTKSICSDPACQSRIEKYKKDRIKTQKEILLNKEIRAKEYNWSRTPRGKQIDLKSSPEGKRALHKN